MRTKILGIVVGVAVLHMVLFLALFGTSGCTSQSVMAPRATLPPVEDNANVIQDSDAVVAPIPVQPFASGTQSASAPVVTPKATTEYPKINLEGLSTGPIKSSSVASAKSSTGGSYTVVSGDTLGGIAHRHGVKTADLASVNGLTMKSVIRVGQKLQIPAGGKAVKSVSHAATASTGKSSKSIKSTTPVSSGVTVAAGGSYVVVKGDFPEKIAKKHKVSTAALLKANNLTEKSVLQIGQKLVIPGAGSVVTPVSSSASTVKPVNTNDLGNLVNNLPTTTPVTPATTNSNVTLPTPPTTTPVVSDPVSVPPVNVPADVVPTVTEAPAAATKLMPLMVDREQSVKDFAARYDVTEDEIRKYNSGVIPADGILKARTIIELPSKD